MRITHSLVLVVALASSAISSTAQAAGETRIAFGSCSHQSRSQAHWKPILDVKPDVFIFCGDNIYSDTYDMALMRKKYLQLSAHQGFQELKKSCKVLATWDDHDYGLNDSDGSFPKKVESKEVFLDFWGTPDDSPRRHRSGVYDSVVFTTQGHKVQVILLDMRYNQSPLRKLASRRPGQGRYAQDRSPGSTFLGAEQWAWLEKQLLVPADVRLIVSSIQVVAQDHNWEKWMNFPLERQRLIAAIEKSGANGVIFVTGDRHHGELSCLKQNEAGYPLYDMTSSGLNMTHPEGGTEPNRHRIGKVIVQNNFGLITIRWSATPQVKMDLITLDGKTAITETVPLSDLAPAASRRAASPGKPEPK